MARGSCLAQDQAQWWECQSLNSCFLFTGFCLLRRAAQSDHVRDASGFNGSRNRISDPVLESTKVRAGKIGRHHDVCPFCAHQNFGNGGWVGKISSRRRCAFRNKALQALGASADDPNLLTFL